MTVKVKRITGCKGKVSFTNVAAAKRAAEKHGQRVYECPVCYCWHCTSKPDWKDEFLPIEKYRNVLKENERLQKLVKKYRVKYASINSLRHNLERALKKAKKEKQNEI